MRCCLSIHCSVAFWRCIVQFCLLVARGKNRVHVCLLVLYGLQVYVNTYASYLDKLTTPNNKILRILQKKGRCCNECLYLQYNTLPPRQLFNYQVLCLVHKMVYAPHLIPSMFWNYFTPSTSIHSYNTRRNKLYLSKVNSQFGGQSLKFKGSQLWNRLPNDLTDITSLESFKKKIEVFLNLWPIMKSLNCLLVT